jgi:undecaprenyl-diphosphatase
MEYTHAIILALLQGLTEFLPISSSAHLILLPRFANWGDQGLAFDVAVHVGTLLAVLTYFRSEVAHTTRAWWSSVSGGELNRDGRLGWAVVFGTLPTALVGLLFHDYIENNLRLPLLIAATTIGFGILLGWADLKGARVRDEYSLTWKDVLVIGLSQALALIPGTSRSGITMTAGLWLGLNRSGAARFSFLLSIPIILLAGALETSEMIRDGHAVEWNQLFVATLVAGLSAYLCIEMFLRLLERIGMLPFVVYRIMLGVLLLLMFGS